MNSDYSTPRTEASQSKPAIPLYRAQVEGVEEVCSSCHLVINCYRQVLIKENYIPFFNPLMMPPAWPIIMSAGTAMTAAAIAATTTAMALSMSGFSPFPTPV